MLDEIDRQIVAELQRDGRAPLEQVAKAVKLSRPAVHDRVRRLEARGLIRGYSAQVDWAQLGYPVTAFVNVRTKGNCAGVTQHILGLPLKGAVVEECHRITGDYCLLIKVRAASTLALQDLLDALREQSALESTHTTIVLSTPKEGTIEDDSALAIRAAAPPVAPDRPR